MKKKPKRYQIVYAEVNERVVKTADINKFMRRFTKAKKIYSVVDLTTYERLM